MHVLNSCKTALELRRYNKRHDEVLKHLYQEIKEHIPSTASSTVDLQDNYSFPKHIAQTDLQPDIIVWDDECKSVTMIELTIPLLSCRMQLTERKKNTRAVTLITVEVGSRGLPHENGFNKLRLSKKTTRRLMISMSKEAIQGSYRVWKSRNTKT